MVITTAFPISAVKTASAGTALLYLLLSIPLTFYVARRPAGWLVAAYGQADTRLRLEIADHATDVFSE